MSFEQFWACFPRRVAKLAAKKAYDKALKLATHEQIMKGVQRYAIHTQNTEHQYIKHPTSWLNGGCWEDKLPQRTGFIPQSKTSELRNDLRQRIETRQGSEDTGSLRQLPQRQPYT